MVTEGEIIPMFRDVAPQWEPDNDDPLYVQLGFLGRDIVTRVASGQTEGLDPIFAAVERLHVDGDAGTREAATIGILESIQNNAGHQNIPLSKFEPMLGPETRRCWDKLLAFWEGRSPTVA